MPDKKHKLPTFTDLREVEEHAGRVLEQERQPEETPYLHTIPLLPEWTDKTYRTQDEKQNLYHLTCTCADYAAKVKRYEPHDVRRLCRHLYYKLTDTKASLHIDELTKQIMKAAVFHNEKRWMKHTGSNGAPLVIGFTDKSDWLNIYIPTDDGCTRCAYHPVERRFAYNASPPNRSELEQEIQMLLGYGK